MREAPWSQLLGPTFADRLGRHHEAATARGALLLQPAADDFLGAAGGFDSAAERVHVGRVEKVDAAFGGLVQDAVRHRLVGLQAECHGAERKPRHGEARAAEAGGGDAHGGLDRGR
ncbi:hypothetical protein ABID97_004485 [Variovorax sp. OAS795]